MKYLHSFLLALLLTLVFVPVQAQTSVSTATTTANSERHRPRIGVVLAGGGAKGVSHVAALKAIEEAGLPVDLVVGTSIGSIVGGMYCTGYSPDSMRQIIRETDWIKMITDNPDFGNNRLSTKKNLENYLLSFTIDPTRLSSGTGLGGVLQGRNVIRFFKDLTRFLPDSLSFDDMPIPFACVGTNAIDGSCKVFTSGNVPMAMRASMAIPSAFTPVSIDSVVYVDGGVVDNLPVDVARQLGAEIVIAVDLVTQTTREQLTNSAIDMLMHCIDLYSKDQYERNIADADIYIPIDVTGYSAASFTPEALDTLIARGDSYVALKKPSLDSLRQTLQLDEEPIRVRVGEYTFAHGADWTNKRYEEENYALQRENGGTLNSTIRLGARFDNQEYASVTCKANMVLSRNLRSLLSLEGRLGERIEGRVTYSQRTLGSQRMGLYYKFQQHELEINRQGTKAIDMYLRLHKLNFYLTQEWRRMRYTFGINYNVFRYSDILMGGDLLDKTTFLPNLKTERFFSYFIKTEVNTLDRQYFPTRGHLLEFSGDLITDNLITYQNRSLFPILSGNWMFAIPCGSHFTILPHASARIMVTEDIEEPISLMNMAGGLFGGMHYLQQTTMAGVSKMELIRQDGLGIGGLTFQYTPVKNHFVVLTGDVMTHTNHVEDALDSESLNWGVEASYNYRSAVGPLGLKFYWSDLTRKFDVSLNLGYYF